MALDMIFATCDGEDIECLVQAIEYATQDLREIGADCEAGPGRPARLDVLQCCLGQYHDRILDEVYPFFAPSSLSNSTNTVLYQLIELILHYNSVLGEVAALLDEEDRPVNPLMCMVASLSDQFARSTSTDASWQLRRTTSTCS